MVHYSSRRRFLKDLSVGAAGVAAVGSIGNACASPLIHRSTDTMVGTGDYQYRVNHQFLALPSEYTWQTTHNVAVDSMNRIYVIHEGREDLKDHPSIFVFDDQGKFINAFGNQYQGGGHGIEVRREGSEEFLYVAAYQQVKAFSKLTLDGKEIWTKKAPKESKVYNEEEYTDPKKVWGRDRFMPTNFAFLPTGGFLLADGYGAFYIHRYDDNGNWVSSFGGAGEGKGTFNTPHGLWIDDRDTSNPKIVVTDRAHNTLQIFDLAGKYLETITGFGLPANIDSRGDLLLVPELGSRVSLLDRQYKVLAHLGSDTERVQQTKGVREDEKLWLDGKFVHPHDACFDRNGDILVAEWVRSGRVTKLTRVR
jgi:DNA-binding beta-propeller fold protein YncE